MARVRQSPRSTVDRAPGKAGQVTVPRRTQTVTDICTGKPHPRAVPGLHRIVEGARSLRPQQVRFALALAVAPSIAEAARMAGYSARSGLVGALVRRPDIRAIAHARQAEIAESFGISSEAVIVRLWKIANNRRAGGVAQVRACEQLLRYLGKPARAVADDQTAGPEADDLGSQVARFAASLGIPVTNKLDA